MGAATRCASGPSMARIVSLDCVAEPNDLQLHLYDNIVLWCTYSLLILFFLFPCIPLVSFPPFYSIFNLHSVAS